MVSSHTAGAAPSMVRLGRWAPQSPPPGATRIGGLPRTESIGLEFVLAPSHPAQLTSQVDALYDRASPQYHDWLTPDEFSARFGPSPSEVSGVQRWLSSVGLHSSYRSGSVLQVSESAGVVESGLGVSFNQYRLAGGRQVHVADRAPLLPTALSASVVSVLGLDDLPQLVPHISQDRTRQSSHLLPRAQGLSPCGAAASEAAGIGGYTADQVGAAYGVGSLTGAGQIGAGQTVGVYELGQHSASDISQYETCFGLHNSVSTVAVDGGGAAGVGGTTEADADIEQVATQAPGTSIISYEGPNTSTGSYDTWHTIVTQDVASVVSTSYGLCEPDSVADGVVSSEDVLFQQAAAQGQTILAASGDSGSEDCYLPPETTDTSLQVDYPASDPYVAGVGGTTLAGDGTQSTWNDCEGQVGPTCANDNGGSGGGGISRIWAPPSWQPRESEWSSAGNACGTDCRDVPDVSANAGAPEVFLVQGAWNAYVGTSIAAPLVAGLVADTTNGCAPARRGAIGQALYDLAGQGAYGTAFSDVTTGDNDLTRTYSPAEYSAGPGYDPVTGIGTPIAAGWSCPEVSSVSPAQGQAGSEVTVGGLGLEKATISFGGRPAVVVSATATSATVVVPAGGGTVEVSATSVMGGGTSTGSFTFPTSAPVLGSGSGYDLVGQDGGVFVSPRPVRGVLRIAPGLGIHVHDIVGMVPSPDDRGYFLVGQDGGVFAFGDAPFLGSLPGLGVTVHDIRGIVPTRDNRGYFLVGQDGGVFAFGDAPFLGSLPGEGIHITDVVGIAATPSDQGYWLVAANGTVYAFGNAAPRLGSGISIAGVGDHRDLRRWWVLDRDRERQCHTFGDARSFGSLPATG